jgi:alpha-glucosidase (family GH31 glycosyl hydrolase)
MLSVWTDSLKNWSDMGVEFSGIWLDMNEPSTFCSYSWCGKFLFVRRSKLIGEKRDWRELLFRRSPDRCQLGGYRIS